MKTGRPDVLIELSDEEHIELLRRSRQRKGPAESRIRAESFWRAQVESQVPRSPTDSASACTQFHVGECDSVGCGSMALMTNIVQVGLAALLMNKYRPWLIRYCNPNPKMPVTGTLAR